MSKALINALSIVLLLWAATAFADGSHGNKHGKDNITVKGVVHTTSPDKINASHEKIPELGWPPMRMDFGVAEGLDVSTIPIESPVELELVKGEDGIFQIQAVTATE